ncbi:MAG TPA: DNA adenine methylase [Candidatus Bathyarchaeia archaeon]|nr:DNA adenine methylase [Candidatus Bathyarchaeia archaeon]
MAQSTGPTLSQGSDFHLAAPFVKWAGGKGRLVRELLSHVPAGFGDFYEPFLGGGAFFFALTTQAARFDAHLSDLNLELIATYNQIKENPEDLIAVLSRLQDEYEHATSKSEYYYGKRSTVPTSNLETVARFIFLNKTCYNGLFRVNSRGEFNVPFGRYAHPRILDAENIRAVSKALRHTNAELSISDFRKSIANCRKNDLVYLDPPYQPVSRTSSFTDYTPDGFSSMDQEVLAEEFEKLVARGCTVLLSNSDTSFTRTLYREYDTRIVTVNRPINSNGSLRTGHKEIIVIGNPS